MARDLDAQLQAKFDGDSLQPFLAVEITFDSGVSRVWGGYGILIIDGWQFVGTGALGGISTISESTENKATGISLNLSGIPNDALAAALRQKYQGKSCTIYMGALSGNDTSGSRGLVGSPIVLFRGKTDRMSINMGPDTSSISVTVENRMIDLERSRVRRYTTEDQKFYHPGDNGFKFVTSIQDKEVPWGVKST